MDNISLVKNKQKEIDKNVKNIKKNIKYKNIKIKENVKKTKSRRKTPRKTRGTIYLGHIPHGFYEKEMMSYFGQFGKVLSASLARSNKTGKSKGFGFVEFENEDVARIAAETMNNYLMYNKVLKCKYIPPNERNGRKLRVIDPLRNPRTKQQQFAMKKKNSALERLNSKTYKKRAENKIEAFRKFFKDKGIDFVLDVNNDNDYEKGCEKSGKDAGTSVYKSTSETDDEFGNLEIDESDSEIDFKTPPHVKKVIIKPGNSSISKKNEAKLKLNKMNSNKELLKKSAKEQKKPNDCGMTKQEKSQIKIKKIHGEPSKKKNKNEFGKTKKIGLKGQKLKKSEKKKNLKSKSFKKGIEEMLKMEAKKLVEKKINCSPLRKKNSPKSISSKIAAEVNQRRSSLRNG